MSRSSLVRPAGSGPGLACGLACEPGGEGGGRGCGHFCSYAWLPWCVHGGATARHQRARRSWACPMEPQRFLRSRGRRASPVAIGSVGE
eukprot:566735-Alexandrium_andersonii.AAC.1